MPFKSRSQLLTCYGTRPKGWDCDEWLDATKSVCCLPYKKGGSVRSRCMRDGERIKGPVRTGARGGKYFTLSERDSHGHVCTIKVYLGNRSRSRSRSVNKRSRSKSTSRRSSKRSRSRSTSKKSRSRSRSRKPKV